jgi:hypothetical protein
VDGEITEMWRAIDLLKSRVEMLENGDRTPPAPRRAAEGDVVFVPDDPYDHALWHGADDEGIGGYKRHHA